MHGLERTDRHDIAGYEECVRSPGLCCYVLCSLIPSFIGIIALDLPFLYTFQTMILHGLLPAPMPLNGTAPRRVVVNRAADRANTCMPQADEMTGRSVASLVVFP